MPLQYSPWFRKKKVIPALMGCLLYSEFNLPVSVGTKSWSPTQPAFLTIKSSNLLVFTCISFGIQISFFSHFSNLDPKKVIFFADCVTFERTAVVIYNSWPRKFGSIERKNGVKHIHAPKTLKNGRRTDVSDIFREWRACASTAGKYFAGIHHYAKSYTI